MAWNVIRKATAADHNRLDARAEAFINRHHLHEVIQAWETDQRIWIQLDYLLSHWRTEDPNETKPQRLARLWRRVKARALGDSLAEGIAWGEVGYPKK